MNSVLHNWQTLPAGPLGAPQQYLGSLFHKWNKPFEGANIIKWSGDRRHHMSCILSLPIHNNVNPGNSMQQAHLLQEYFAKIFMVES